MHKRNIQLEILTKLLRSETLRYRDARPARVANDLFNYHLQFLVQKGLVIKKFDQYSLTEDGKYYVNTANPLNPLGEIIDKFKINVLTIVFKKEGSKMFVLNQLRKRQPFYGLKGVMGGPIRAGEPLEKAAQRKLLSETGLEADFKVLGAVRKITLDKQGKVFSDIMFIPCLSRKATGTLKTTTPFGENYWAEIDEAIKNESQPVSPTKKIVGILQQLKNNPDKNIVPFLDEETQFTDNASF